MADIAVSVALVLVEKVLSFLDKETNLQKNVYDDVQDIRIWLRTVKAYLSDMDRIEDREARLKDRVNQVRDLAYDMEDVLDEFMLRVPYHFHRHTLSKFAHEVYHSIPNRQAFHEMSSKVKDVKRKMNEIIVLDPLRVGIINLEEGASSGARVEDHVTHQSLEEDEIMGFEEHKKNLMHQLVNKESRRMKISVVGPGGSGKSILVKNVYENNEVLGKFDCHAWIHVSRRSKNIDEHLWSMVKQFCEGREEPIPPGVDVRAKLRNYLQQKRYVVVLDDVWRQEDWECIVNALPNGYGGSRIIVTTRNSGLASSCVESQHDIHELNGLSWKEAWKLFCRKAFRTSKGLCPPELEEWSKKIVKRCEGLPLAIVAVGSLLSNKAQIPNEWKKLHDSLGSEIGTDSNLSIISRILMPSYQDLSSNLKSCFLYFCIFPEDYSIKRGRLIRLWVAEGFVEKRRGKTLEEVAEDYLNELIGRNLVQASTRDFDGRVSSCRVVNLVREFIILKSEEENFVSIVTEQSTSLSEKVRRLSIHYACTKQSQIRGLSCVRTAFMIGMDDSFCFKIGKLLHDFQLLRVLDLQGAPLQDFPKEVTKLILLRYLSLRQTNIETVPNSIKKLSYLETLDLKNTCVTKLPVEIFQLQFLRHLLVYRYNVVNYVTYDSVQGVEVSAGIGALSAIQKLTLIKANKHRGIIKELGDLIQLRKLGLVGLRREDGKKLCASIQKMQNLSTLDVSSTSEREFLDLDEMDPPRHLQRLYLKGCLQKLPGWISSLDSLVRISLKWSKLNANESPLVILQALPNLMELEMVDYYTGKALEFKATTFKKLKILHLEQFDGLNMVVVEQGAMSELQKLTICKCENLKILPLGISDLTKLEELLLYDMHKDFISRLEKSSEDHLMVRHIRVIHSHSSVGMSQSFSLRNLY